VGSNLRKVRRDSKRYPRDCQQNLNDFVFKGLVKTDNVNSNSNDRRSRQSQSVGPSVKSYEINGDNSSLNSDVEYSNNRENITWKPTGFQTVSFIRS
jgi:hypothetical protein